MELSCPTADRLREFLEGSVGDAESDQISRHVVECRNCDRALDTLEREHGDLLKELRDGVLIESLLQEPEFEQLRNTARHGQADTIAPPDVDELPETGKRLRDYRLVKKIGEGGMGTVYQAVHVHLAKQVAIKILPADKLRSRQSVSRFRQEMRAVGKVNHQNVVSASDAGAIDGQHFLVMELVQGADLARIIQDQGPLNVADACEIVRQAAIGLQHAHDNGLVHRDVKPSNIMLTLDGNVKLLDLGLAGLNNMELEAAANVVVNERLTSVGQIMGTLDYMAPEQITASPQIDGKADVYALGATLFQLLTGRTPCGDRSEGTPERIEAVLRKPPLDIATLRDDVPEQLCSLLLKMLAKKPEDRPQAAIDVAAELQRFTSDADLIALAEACRTSLDMPSADVDVTDEVSFVVSRAEKTETPIPPRRPFAAVALAGLFLSLFVAVICYIVTNKGVVQIEIFDDSVKVAIDDRTVTVNQGNNQAIKLWVGEHKLVVSDGDTELITDTFEIRRNDKIAFRVQRLKDEVVVSIGQKKYRSAATREVRTNEGEPKTDQTQLTESKLRSTQFSAVALVDGCEVSGRFTAKQAEVSVHNATKEHHDIRFHYQIVYQNSRMPGDIARLTAGEFHATVRPGESALKRFDNLVDASAGVPTKDLKDLLVMRVFYKPIKSTGDCPILPDEKLDLSRQLVAIASWPAAGTELSKSKRASRVVKGREGITAIGRTGSHCRLSGSFTRDQACLWVLNPYAATQNDHVYYQVILRDSKSPESTILLKEGELHLESEYNSKHVRRIDLRSDPDASVPTDHSKDTIEFRVSQEPLDLKYIPITPEEEPYIRRGAVTIASWPTQLVAVNTKGKLAFIRERELKGLAARVAKVDWSGDGERICAVDGTGQLRVWDAATGEQLGAHSLGLNMSWRPMAFSSDLKLMVIGLDEHISIRRVVDNVEVTRITPPIDPKRKGKFIPALAAMAFSPDDKRLLVASSRATVWDVESGALIHKSKKLSTAICAVAWSRDGGKYAAYTAGYELYARVDPAEVCIWDSNNGEKVNTFTIRHHGQYGYDFGMWVATDYLAFSPDGQRIVVGNGTRGAEKKQQYRDRKSFVQEWDLKSGKTTRVVPEGSTAVGSLQFNSDGRLRAMHSDDKVRFWETESGQELTTLTNASKIISFDFHPREDVIVTGHEDGSVQVIKLK